MSSVYELLKAHTDKGGDLRSVPIGLLNALVTSDNHLSTDDLVLMFMLVYQKKRYNKDQERVTSLSHWIANFEWEPSYYSKTYGRIKAESEDETKSEVEAKAEERERWRRVSEPSPTSEASKRKRKRKQ